MSTLYLTRYGNPAQGVAALVDQKPELIVVIPSFDEPKLIDTLKSVAASNSEYTTLVIPVINFHENSSEEVKLHSEKTFEQIQEWAIQKTSENFQVVPLKCEFSEKRSGVGMARKVGMDEAVRVYEQFDSDGIIVNLDADCTVKSNYVPAIVRHFKRNQQSPAAVIHYEHLLESPENDEAIISYELHLRYFVNMQRFCLLPYAHQTVGSCMAVRSRDYQKQGGMNKRKAGEDFYFLMKMMLLGNFSEINDTVVFPSSRTSDRVPFGTGRAMLEWQAGLEKRNSSYHPESFLLLKIFLDMMPEFFFKDFNGLRGRIPLLVWQFMESQKIHEVLLDIKKKSKDIGTFQRHFYGWFDGFRLMKYVHFSRDHFYADQEITYCIKWYFENVLKRKMPKSLKESLDDLRKEDQNGLYTLGYHSFGK
ncbi:MAG: glycosyltransferase family 2 protein [Bacteroidota bacterium]